MYQILLVILLGFSVLAASAADYQINATDTLSFTEGVSLTFTKDLGNLYDEYEDKEIISVSVFEILDSIGFTEEPIHPPIEFIEPLDLILSTCSGIITPFEGKIIDLQNSEQNEKFAQFGFCANKTLENEKLQSILNNQEGSEYNDIRNLLIGLGGGSLFTWYVSRHYYKKGKKDNQTESKEQVRKIMGLEEDKKHAEDISEKGDEVKFVKDREIPKQGGKIEKEDTWVSRKKTTHTTDTFIKKPEKSDNKSKSQNDSSSQDKNQQGSEPQS